MREEKQIQGGINGTKLVLNPKLLVIVYTKYEIATYIVAEISLTKSVE